MFLLHNQGAGFQMNERIGISKASAHRGLAGGK
jgi:hypothetical protein